MMRPWRLSPLNVVLVYTCIAVQSTPLPPPIEATQLFFLATPSTASSTVNRVFEEVFNRAQKYFLIRSTTKRKSSSSTPDNIPAVEERWPGIESSCPDRLNYRSAAPQCHAEVVSKHLNITYRGKTHMDLRYSIKTRDEVLREKLAMKSRNGSFWKPPISPENPFARSQFLQVDNMNQPVVIITVLRSPEAWIRSVARRFYQVLLRDEKAPRADGDDTSDEKKVAVWIEQTHWLWNAQTRMLAGNFSAFGEEVLEGCGERSRSSGTMPCPTRAAAEAWSSMAPVGDRTTTTTTPPRHPLVERALRALRNGVVWFAITERLEDSVRVAAHRFCWRWDRDAMRRRLQRQRHQHNKAPATTGSFWFSSRKEADLPELKAAVGKRFALDQDVYQAADDLLTERLDRARSDSRRGVICAVGDCDVTCGEGLPIGGVSTAVNEGAYDSGKLKQREELRV